MCLDHFVLTIGAIIMTAPLVYLFFAASVPGGLSALASGALPGLKGLGVNLAAVSSFFDRAGAAPDVPAMLITSFVLSAGIACISTFCAFSAAYCMVFITPKAQGFHFGLLVLVLFFPLEARMLPTLDVVITLGLVNTWAGLVLPVLPLAMATLILWLHMRQFPASLLDAARLDGAGPFRFLVDFVLPMSRAPLGAVLLIGFVWGWNQYLWPLMVSLDGEVFPLMRALNMVGAGSGPSMALATLAMLPPLMFVLIALRLIRKSAIVEV